MQVGVIPGYQKSVSFLWREDPSRDVEVYKYIRHILAPKVPRLGLILA